MNTKDKTNIKLKEKVKSNVETKPKSKKELTITAFCMMGFLTLFSILNVMDLYFSANIMALPIFIGVALIFLVPFTLMILEFTSLDKAEGSQSGLNKWVELSTTKKLAFMTAFAYWLSRLPYLALASIKLVSYLSFGIFGKDLTSSSSIFGQLLPWLAIGMLAVMTFIATQNLNLLGKFAKFSGMFSIMLIALFFIGSIAGLIGGAEVRPNDPPFNGDNIWGDKIAPSGVFDIVMMITVITWFIKSVDGMQGFSVYQDQVQGGRKGFVRGMLILLGVMIFVHVFGILLMEVFAPPDGGNTTLLTIFFHTFANMFQWIFGGSIDDVREIIFHVFGFALFILSFTAYLLWIGISVRILAQEAPENLFPKIVTKRNKNNVPQMFAWIQYCLVIPFVLIVSYTGGAGGEVASTLNTISGVIKLLPLILIIFAYFELRRKRDWEKRSYKMGNRLFGMGISLFNIGVMLFVFVFAVKGADPDRLWVGILTTIIPIVVAMGSIIGLLYLYDIKMTSKQIMETKKLNSNICDDYYSIIYRIKLLFKSKKNVSKKKFISELEKMKKNVSFNEIKKILKDKKLKTKNDDLKNMEKLLKNK